MAEMPEKPKLSELLAEHYQKTYEVTYELWRERNRMFPSLAAAIGGGLLLAFKIPAANNLVVGLIAAVLKMDNAQQTTLQTNFPFEILQTVLLAVILQLMLDLYRHTLDIDRGYEYLGGLEVEIRQSLGLAKNTIAFTREDEFYQHHHPKLQSRGIRWVYNIVLFFLLGFFLIARIGDDLQRGNLAYIVVNTVIAVPIVVYFIAYATAGLKWSRKKQ